MKQLYEKCMWKNGKFSVHCTLYASHLDCDASTSLSCFFSLCLFYEFLRFSHFSAPLAELHSIVLLLIIKKFDFQNENWERGRERESDTVFPNPIYVMTTYFMEIIRCNYFDIYEIGNSPFFPSLFAYNVTQWIPPTPYHMKMWGYTM